MGQYASIQAGDISQEDYYLADLSLHFALNTDNRINYGPVLENIVYRHAKGLGYEVSVGRIGKLECDFIMRGRDMGYSYVQVTMTIMASEKTEDREYRPLEQIRDSYPKFVLTRADPIQRRSGIIHENVPELIAGGPRLWRESFMSIERGPLAREETRGSQLTLIDMGFRPAVLVIE